MLQEIAPPEVPEAREVEAATRAACEAVSAAAQECRLPRAARQPQWDAAQPRWERILATNDPKTIWRSVDWKGQPSSERENKPSDEEFKVHFDSLLNVDQEVEFDVS